MIKKPVRSAGKLWEDVRAELEDWIKNATMELDRIVRLGVHITDDLPTDEGVSIYNGETGAWELRELTAADIKNVPTGTIAGADVQVALNELDAEKVPKTTTITTTAPLTGGGDLSANRTLAVSDFTGDAGAGGTRGTVPAPAAGDAAAGKFLKASGAWAAPAAPTDVANGRRFSWMMGD